MAPIDVSIVIPTRNRAASLRQTLESVLSVQVDSSIRVELVVVDNNSTDTTEAVVAGFASRACWIRYAFEAVHGVSSARNRGVSEKRERVILFADDDVRFPEDWLATMSTPILKGDVDASSGGMRIAPHLRRPWMEGHESVWVELLSDPPDRSGGPLITANCAYSRAVFAKVPAFDDRLDAGQLGPSGDTFFANQVYEAGFRVGSAIGRCQVEHHFDSDRLRRSALLQRAAYQGASDAYVYHHWLHRRVRFATLKIILKH